MDIILKQATQDNLKSIAKCYMNSFPNSVSTKLGLNYITHNLGWFLNDEKKILFFIEIENICVGFCGGYIWEKSGDGSTSSMLKYSKSIRNAILIKKPWLLFNYEIIKKIFTFIIIKSSIIIKNKYNKIDPNARTMPSLGLVVIGVHSNYKGNNISSKLMEEFIRKGKEIEISNFHLSVRKNNLRAYHFYLKHGWKVDELTNKGKNTFSMKIY